MPTRSKPPGTRSSPSTCSTTTSTGAESALTERAVYERDIAWLESCDLLIADASGSSFGVGFEVGYVLGRSDRTDQRVLLLYRADRRDAISRLIVGNAHPRCAVLTYENPDELLVRVSESLTPTAANRA